MLKPVKAFWKTMFSRGVPFSSGMSAAALLTSAGPPESVGKTAKEESQQHAAGTQDARCQILEVPQIYEKLIRTAINS